MDNSLKTATYRRVSCRSARRFAVTFTVLACMMCSTVSDSRIVWGQDDWDAIKEEVALPAAQNFRLPDFNQWVFRNKTNAQLKQTFKSRLTVRLDSVERTYDLSEAQREKLELAGRGDMRRFFRQADELRAKFGGAQNDQQKFQEIAQAVQPLQAKMNSLFFDDQSLLQKALKGTLNREQSGKYEERQRERRKFHYEARIELALTTLEAGVPLLEQQRQQFVKLLLEETEPPRKYGQQAAYVVFFQANTLEEKLKPIFDDAQWKALKRVLSQAEGMEAHLKRNGFIP